MSAPAAVGRETRIVLLLCGLAALRVFLFSAAFPFFNNVDEQSHFDLVVKYSRGHVPHGLEGFDVDAVRTIVWYGSPEYLAEAGPGEAFLPPLWSLPSDAVQEDPEAYAEDGRKNTNHEATQPPLYYAVAGAWRGLGEGIGLRDGQLLYWSRFLNVPLVALATWLAYAFARRFFPGEPFVRLGVPLLVAFFPQDVFYSVNNDVLLPLAAGAAFFGLLAVHRGEREGLLFHAVAGLFCAAAFLVKQSSVGLLLVAPLIVALRILRSKGSEERKAVVAKGAVLLAAAAAPIAAWSLRSHLVLGDLTGAAVKAESLGWSPKPWGELLDHPLLAPAGLATFWHKTLASFWRGELVWGLKSLATIGWDRFYSLSSLALLVCAMVWAKRFRPEERSVLRFSLLLFAVSIAFLAAISLAFDFGACFYPSREHPFLTSGRLAMGALIPFAALYVSGLRALLPGPKLAAARWAALVALVASMTFSEVVLARPAFASEFNWYHLVGKE